MNDMAYYRNLIENLLKEQPDDDIPQLPSRAEIDKRKFAHMVKTGRLPAWAKKVQNDNGTVYFDPKRFDHIDLSDGWSIVEIDCNSTMIDNVVFINGIYVYLDYRSDNDDYDYDVDYDVDPDVPLNEELLCDTLNKVFTDYFETPIHDVQFEDWHEYRTKIVLVSSEQVSAEITKWTPILVRK